ncbi:acetate/propionate family kinase [Tunturiibacter lichenicola]|uniref:acetate/propionate family kinase n=1 Tax=Tunturiibacter lichenicola TaxID=2051959 RepID=UPI003D9B2604
MNILVINSGSSSIKFSLFKTGEGEPRSLFEGEVTGIGGEKAAFKFRDAEGRALNDEHAEVNIRTPIDAIRLVVNAVSKPQLPKVEAVGYRVVHPGPKLDRHQLITDAVLKDLEDAVVFAPLHDPAAIEVIKEMMSKFPDVHHYACFDTVFHQTMPETATTYPLPMKYRDQGVRRYGFHGLSCESIVRQLQAEKTILFPKRMVIAHLGSGCSVTALLDGRSVDTTMGLTPTGGVVMGTRPGDLDPGLMLYLLRQMQGDPIAALEKMLNHDAGMVALSGLPNDMKTVREAAAKGDPRANLAVEIFTRSVKKAIGSFIALLGGVDTVVFAGGIGEHDTKSREEILSGLGSFGISINSELNTAKGNALRRLSASQSQTAVFVVPAKEDWMIAVHVEHMARS